jgi:hypothetical protein
MKQYQRYLLLMLLCLVAIYLLLPLLGCGCSEKDGQKDGNKGGENTASSQGGLNQQQAQTQYDPCTAGSVYEGSFSTDIVRTGTQYTGSVTILPCSSSVEWEAYFKGDSARKTVGRGTTRQAQEYSDSFTTTTSEEFTKFCIMLSGDTSGERCFSR